MQQGTSIAVALVAGALGGVLGNVATGLLRPHAPEPKPATADFSDDLRDLSDKVSALDAQVTRLSQQRRMDVARSLPAPAAQPSGDAQAARPAADDPAFETAVRDVMEKAQHEREKDREARRAQAAQHWADTLAEKLELTDKQKNATLVVAEDVMQKMRDLRDAEPGAGPGPSFREQRTAMIAQGEQRLGEVLSARQMAVYKDSPDVHLDTILRGGGGFGRGGP
jgi:hypothetical protein